MGTKRLTRREFLLVSATGAAGVVLAACAPAATPTTAPVEPTTAPVAAEATPTAIATQAATATAVPTVAVAAKESPALAELVKAGKLPPLEQRLPKVPLTLAPINAVGKYGGRIRTIWKGDWSGHFQESQYGHSPLRWIDDGLGIAPGMCDKWSTNADNSVWTLHIREGLKWSDGQPCTVDDVLFWWNDLTKATSADNPDSVPDFGTDANQKLAVFAKVDDYTLTITYGTPSPLTAKRLAMWVNANIGPRWICPMHWAKQYVPKYNTAEKDWKDFNAKVETWTNPEMPTLNSWVVTKYEAGKSKTAERNPYYYAVDTQGNQLPYIDGMDWTQVQDVQVELLQTRQGSIDWYHFNDFTLADISTLKDGEATGNYTTLLWDSGSGTAMMYFWNYDHADPKFRKLYRTPEFKQAMSFALDRASIQKSVYYETGILTTGTMSPKAFEFNFNADAQAYGKKAREIYAKYDPEGAKALLDKAGVKAGADGKRTFPDGSKLEISVDIPADASKECTDVLDIAKKNWEAVGLTIIVNQITPTAYSDQWHSGKLSIHSNWEVGDGPDHLLYPSWVVPNEWDRWAPLTGRVLMDAGTPLATSEANVDPWSRKPPRMQATDADFKGSPMEAIVGFYNQAILEPDEVKRANLVYKMWDIHEQQGPFFIGTVANYPRIIIASKKLDNVPTKEQLKLGGFVNPWILPYPAVVNPETWYFKA